MHGRAAFLHLPDCFRNLTHTSGLQKIARCAGADCRKDFVRIVEYSQDQHLGFRREEAYSIESLNPVNSGKANVEQEHVRSSCAAERALRTFEAGKSARAAETSDAPDRPCHGQSRARPESSPKKLG